MPHVMDSAIQAASTVQGNSLAVDCEYSTIITFGEEIEEMAKTKPAIRGQAQQDLLPDLESANAETDLTKRLPMLRAFATKARQWIDKKQLNP